MEPGFMPKQKFFVIVCVDDERIVLESVKKELTEVLGVECLIETAESGEEAVQVFEELLAEHHEIPLVIADYIMPDMKGDELLQRIHALSPRTLKIMLTGQADLTAVTNSVNNADLYRYIGKPWEKTDLVLTVKEALRRYFQDQQLEEQNRLLQNMNATLEQQVRERTAALEQANASKDKFFSIIAHDLRAPFTGLLGLTDLFLAHLEDFTLADIKESLHALQNTTKTVHALLENLLTWARLQRGGIEYFPEDLWLRGLVERNLALFMVTAAQKQITLRNLTPADASVYADRNMMNTVLQNLISNALKFTSAGGAIEVSARPQEAFVEVAVTDTGVGISAADLPKLFRIEVKYTNVGTAGEKGTGLGLILCKELVAHNRGQIGVASALGQGTTFRFTLPTAPDSDALA